MSDVSDTLLQEIAGQYGTPTYIYDLDTVTRQVGSLRRSLPDATLLYAVKANPNGAVLRHLANLELGAEVITLGELERAVRAGIASERILLGGPRQDETLVTRAIDLGVGSVSLDSTSQWAVWRTKETSARFFVRVNPALDPGTHDHLATGAATSKFGMTVEEAQGVAAKLSERGQLAGFHVHAGSQIGSSTVYDEIFAVLEPLYKRFTKADALDIGGGFAVPGFDLAAFATKVSAFSSRFGLRVLLEPGRYLVAPAGILLSRVLHVKSGALEHVIADAGMADLLRPALYGAEHPISVVGKSGAIKTTDVDGPLCENADRLGRSLELPKLCPGDLIKVEQTGAYGFAMASNYASSLRPAEVVVQDGRYRLVRERETVKELLRLELD